MITGIDHVLIACEDPGAAALELEQALGLRASSGGHHESLGTVNRLVWLGDTYLELIGVTDRARAAAAWIGPPVLAALDAGGGMATYALASDDIGGDLSRLRSAGAELDGPIPGERRRPDQRMVRWSLGLPARLGLDEPPFLIEHDLRSAEWTIEERRERSSDVHPLGGIARLARVDLPVGDVHRVAMRYVRTLGVTFRPSLAGGGARDATVGAQTLRLRPIVRGPAAARTPVAGPSGERPRVSIVIQTNAQVDRRIASALGCQFVLEPVGTIGV